MIDNFMKFLNELDQFFDYHNHQLMRTILASYVWADCAAMI